MNIKEQQERDSIRMVWNTMPATKTRLALAAIPQALHYTPLQQHQDQILSRPPPQCRNCSSYLNPYSRLHLDKTKYTCCLCSTENHLPQDYFSEGQPHQLTLNYSSFVLSERVQEKNEKMGYLFVVDAALSEKQLRSIKQSMEELIDGLSDSQEVGLIAYHKYVEIYELKSQFPKIHTFSPHQNYQTSDFARFLGYKSGNNSSSFSKIMTPVGSCRQNLKMRLKSLSNFKSDSYIHQRSPRATGVALNLAISITELISSAIRIVFFSGGPCTIGQGKVVQHDYKNEMRSLQDPIPALSISAAKYYSQLANKNRGKLQPIDAFLFSVEEIGFKQMSQLLTQSGGLLIQHEQFDSSIFRDAFRKAYIGLNEYPHLEKVVFSGTSIKHSPQITFSCSLKNPRKNMFPPHLTFGQIDENYTITLIFDLSDQKIESQAFYIQFKTQYRYPQNLSIRFTKITTVRRLFSDHIHDINEGFDQGAAIALLAKLAVSRSEEWKAVQIRQWLDKTICKWASLLAEYVPSRPQTFKLSTNLRHLPQFIYHLRRNPIVRRTRMSLDEFTYLCQNFLRQKVENVVLMIQPALLSYSIDHPFKTPAMLHEKQLKADSILLLDSFFNIVQWRGSKIIEELNKDTQPNLPEGLLKSVQSDRINLLSDRYPIPMYYLTGHNLSKERFIKSRLQGRQGQLDNNLSEEAELSQFTDRIIELVVNQQL